MAFTSTNPATGAVLKTIQAWGEPALEQCLREVARATPVWAAQPLADRAALLCQLAVLLRMRQEALARLVTLEMGKLRAEALAEIEKCAWGCEYYAEHGAAFLAPERVVTDATQSYVRYEPLGTVLAVMPWNFPFWQVFRCATPALMAGNTVVLKHAANVPQCALAIEELFRDAGFPADVFRTLLIESQQVERVIADPRVQAVSVTGSVEAGRAVAIAAGGQLKKTVLELGGSDAFIVLDDADLEVAVAQAVTARFLNAGQSCIAAKRMIVVQNVADAFVQGLKAAVESLRPDDPLAEATTLAPLARADLRDELHAQVSDSIAQGAIAVTGCAPLPGPGNYYAPSLLDQVKPGMRAWHEELFGPVACVLRARDERDAVRIANDSCFGLGGSVWTQDSARGERITCALQCGAVFVNGIVKSDPRLPFGGIKQSGYGRELSRHGLLEFVNIKTVWIK